MTTIGKVLIGLGVAFAVCAGGGYFAWNGIGDAGLAEQKRRAVALGLPTEPNAVNPRPTPERNAANLLVPVAGDLAKWKSRDGKAFREVWRTVPRSELARLQPLIGRAIHASQRPELAFGSDYRLGPYVLFRELSASGDVARLLVRDAIDQAAQGREDAAFDRLDAAARISALIGLSEPNLLTAVIQVATSQITFRGIQRVIADLNAAPSALARADGVLDLLGPGPDLRNALAGEFAGWVLYSERIRIGELERLDRVQSGEDKPNPEFEGADAQWLVPSIRKRMIATYYRTFLDYYESLPEDRTELAYAYQVGLAFDKRVKADRRVDTILTRIMLPEVGPAQQAMATQLAMHRAMRCLIIALRTNAQSLPDLGEDSIDPFTRKPLKFVRKGKEIKVYSVGRNLKDDGGDGNKGLDAVARYPIYAEPTNR